MCLQCVSVVRLIVATQSSNILISDNIIKKMPHSVATGTPCIIKCVKTFQVQLKPDNRKCPFYVTIYVYFPSQCNYFMRFWTTDI